MPGYRHGFTTRVPGIEVRSDKHEALRRLDQIHRAVRAECGLGAMPFLTAEQVHGNDIAVIRKPQGGDRHYPACDGLVTDQLEVCLGIYVADCAAVYLVDPVRRCLGLVHSGRKGTELGIVGCAIDLMAENFGSIPADLIVQLSPCVRPPHYEVDFAAEIVRVARLRGIEKIHDGGICTASDLDRYYSYRAEKGKTGRMLAFHALLQSPATPDRR